MLKDFRDLKSNLEDVQTQLYSRFDLENSEGHPNDGYRQRMPRFVHDASARLASLNDKITLARSKYTEVLVFFGEEGDEKGQKNAMEFFGLLKTFVSSYKVHLSSAPMLRRALIVPTLQKVQLENKQVADASRARKRRLEVCRTESSLLHPDS